MTDIYKLIENLTADELIELNKHIVERAKELRRKESLEASKKFRMGDEVYFIDQGKKIKGTVLSVNSKRIKVEGPNQVLWSIPPQLLVSTGKRWQLTADPRIKAQCEDS